MADNRDAMGDQKRAHREQRTHHEHHSEARWRDALQPLAQSLEEAFPLDAGVRVDLIADLREAPAAALSERFSEPLVRLMQGRLLLIELFSRPVTGADLDRAAFAALQARERFGTRKIAVLLLGWGRRKRLWERLAPWPDARSDFGRQSRSLSGVPLVAVDVEAVPMEAGWAIVALSSRLEALGPRLARYLQREEQMGEAVREVVEETAEAFEELLEQALDDTMRREPHEPRQGEQQERRALLRLVERLRSMRAPEKD